MISIITTMMTVIITTMMAIPTTMGTLPTMEPLAMAMILRSGTAGRTGEAVSLARPPIRAIR